MHRICKIGASVVLTAMFVTATASAGQADPPPAPVPQSFDELADTLAATEKEPTDVASSADPPTARTAERPQSNDLLSVEERERPDRAGRNDELDQAQRIRGLGTSRRDRFQDAVISGHLADVAAPAILVPTAEDDGAIPLATPTGLSTDRPDVAVSASIGDGPHGIAGSGTGDFDFYLVEDAVAGQVLTVDVNAQAIGSDLDPVIAVVAPTGQILAFNDDSPELDSFVQFDVPSDGDLLVAVAAFGSLPTNPFDPASGTGATSEGAYDLTLSYDFEEDVDTYRLDLRAGDVVGAGVFEARVLDVFDPSGTLVMSSGRDRTIDYPFLSPLNFEATTTLDHVAAVDGPHYVRVSRGPGEYALNLRVRRPGIESDEPGARQVLFLDFDGAFVDPAIFGTDSGDLSPMASFLAGWGLGLDDEDALIDAIVATFTENLQHDPAERGGNERFDVEIRTSRDGELWGQPNVTRIIIGGTRDELDFSTVGLAESVDPGNFAREETGVVLLDQASSPAGSGLATINDFATPGVDMVGLVGQVIGFIASHEAGHLLGNHHTAPNNGVLSIMDTRDLSQLGLGPDLVFGTADDEDVDFVTDEMIEFFVGAEDTMARVAFALSTPAPPRR